MKSDTTEESLNQLSQAVVSSFHANYYQKWADAVKKERWWIMGKEQIKERLSQLIKQHLMVS